MLAQKQFFMYNVVMKKIFVFIISALLLTAFTAPNPCSAKSLFGNKIAQSKYNKSEIENIKKVILQQEVYANAHNLEDIQKLYSDDFVNSDGFNKEAYVKLIEETWKTYPDITYKTNIRNIEFTDNYGTVFADETASATTKEEIGEFDVFGEIYSATKCVYHLEKRNTSWIITSERVIEEKTSLKYGEARFLDMSLDVPKQIGSNKQYTATLKVDVPEGTNIVGSISREKIVYPQTKSEDAFRNMYDNVLERIFTSNTDNVNEYAVASVGIAHTSGYNENNIRVYLSGMAFIMSRVNVVPENKFINLRGQE